MTPKQSATTSCLTKSPFRDRRHPSPCRSRSFHTPLRDHTTAQTKQTTHLCRLSDRPLEQPTQLNHVDQGRAQQTRV